MKKILIATRNRAKFKELESGTVASIGKSTKILSLNDLKIKEGIDETGLTFENNARIKAKYYTYGWFWPKFLVLGFAACFFSASAALRGFGGWLY